MRIIYDPAVDALTIRLVEERVECEVIRLNDQVAVDIGPGERIVAIEVLDVSELFPGLKERGVYLENLPVFSEGGSKSIKEEEIGDNS
ncbi:MAG: DUF2283 domain-containing protein [Nitrososphaerota archaeon]